MDEQTLLDHTPPWAQKGQARPPTPMLVLVWSLDEPQRVGELLWHDTIGPGVFGRASTGKNRLQFWRLGPEGLTPRGECRAPRISRDQLELQTRGQTLHLHNLGRCQVLVDGELTDSAVVRPGQVIELRYQAVFLCVLRSPDGAAVDILAHPFGEADPHGIIGESEASWMLRQRIQTLGRRREHVLVTGPSGSGKELISQALHRLSPRKQGPFIARNAATFPEGLIDAELFGNIRDYPNPGMPARPGLIGEADGGTLFLDEIGELPTSLQARLLRIMDNGDYQRLGDATNRRATLRLVGATNRAPEELKSDVLARFTARIDVPGLDQRREDIALIARALALTLIQEDPTWERFIDGHGLPNFTSDLMTALVTAPYTTHVRQLRAALLHCMERSAGRYIEYVSSVSAVLSGPATSPDTGERERIAAALKEHNGHKGQTAAALGLSRHQLGRLIKKLGL